MDISSQVEYNPVKFMYLQDTRFRRERVMTIARQRVSDTEILIAYCVNHMSKSPHAQADNGYVPEEFGDNFSKAMGRKIAEGRLEKEAYVVTRNEDERFHTAILRWLADVAPDHYANKIAKQAIAFQDFENILRAITLTDVKDLLEL